jgi:hypothetical protein
MTLFVRERRDGTIGVVALLALPVLLLLFALVLNLASARWAKTEVQNAGDAAALAGARALADDSFLLCSLEQKLVGAHFQRSADAASALGGANVAHGQRVVLRFDFDNPPDGDIEFGCLAHPRGTFRAVHPNCAVGGGDHPINAIKVIATTGPVPGPLGGLNPGSRIKTRSVAMLDFTPTGFQPKGDELAPIVPIGVFTDHTGERADGWDAVRKTAGDRARCDPNTHQFVPGPDGIPEITVVIGGARAAGEVPGTFLQLGTNSSAEVLEQFRSGMTPAQCEKFAGGFLLGEDNTLIVTGSPACPSTGSDAQRQLSTALGSLVGGPPRIWPFFAAADEETGRVWVSGWVGARVVSVAATSDGGFRLVLQPAVVCHPSVVTDPDRAARPVFWGANRTVCRARLAD